MIASPYRIAIFKIRSDEKMKFMMDLLVDSNAKALPFGVLVADPLSAELKGLGAEVIEVEQWDSLVRLAHQEPVDAIFLPWYTSNHGGDVALKTIQMISERHHTRFIAHDMGSRHRKNEEYEDTVYSQSTDLFYLPGSAQMILEQARLSRLEKERAILEKSTPLANPSKPSRKTSI